MKGLREYQPVVLELWSAHQAMLALGFVADDIYVGMDAVNTLAVILRTQGKEFIYTLGRLQNSSHAEGVLAEWNEFTEAHNQKVFDRDELDSIYSNSYIMVKKVDFVRALLGKGIELPEKYAEEVS